MRDEWEINFAPGGKEALEWMESHPVDVIISDMQMPGMDGAQLLYEVLKSHPDTVRIILSGHADREMILRSVRPAHQYLSKPCNADILKSTIQRACNLRESLADEEMKKLISKMDTLPSLPSLYIEIMKEIQSPDSSIKRVATIIEKDMGMSAKILQLVNSAFFGVPRHISSPVQAVTMLGLEMIKALVLSIHVFLLTIELFLVPLIRPADRSKPHLGLRLHRIFPALYKFDLLVIPIAPFGQFQYFFYYLVQLLG